MLEHQLYKLDSAAWYADEDGKLRKKFTKVDRFGQEYKLYTFDYPTLLVGLPRNYGHPEVAQQLKVQYSDGYSWADGFVPRDAEQKRMVEDAAYLFKTEGRMGFIMEAPTGYGKTYLGSAVIQRLGQRACVITTKQDIMKQWVEALSNVLCIPESDVQLWHGDKVPDESAQAVVALVQSVSKGYERYPKELYDMFGIVLVDEVHRMGAEHFSEAMWYFPARYRLGLSATPYRKDGREQVFEAHIGPVEVSTEAKALPFRAICVDTQWQVPEVWQFDPVKRKQIYGPLQIPYDRAIIGVKHLQDDEHRNSIIANFVKAALRKDRSTVIFSDTVDHLKAIRETLIAHGMDPEAWGYYVGLHSDVYKRTKVADRPLDENGTYTGYRERIREQHATRPVVGATYKMASEATNKPWWDTAVLATAKADVVQILGRIRREYPDKKFPTVLDLCDYNHQVFATFAKKRRKWYLSEGAEIILK